jgi:dTDP-glucose 4,6-dehydratase
VAKAARTWKDIPIAAYLIKDTTLSDEIAITICSWTDSLVLNTRNQMKILVTGGAGFIGANFVRYLLANTSAQILNIDKLVFPGCRHTIELIGQSKRHRFVQMDICDQDKLSTLIADFEPDWIAHLAAESHVDRSIDSPHHFVRTNVLGTLSLLEAAKNYWGRLTPEQQKSFRYLQVSTDEVMGSLGVDDPPFSETSPYQPRSPYAASKAAADHLARAWQHTYGFPVIITNCSNNYGPFQFPEKLIPLTICRALALQTLPVYGDGGNIRDWLFVADHVEALFTVMERGIAGQTYGIGGHCELDNLTVVRQICKLLDQHCAKADGSYSQQIRFVKDRPGHDFRYAMETRKIESELGWSAKTPFASGLQETAKWYINNQDWAQRVMEKSYSSERLGLNVP